jgi:hypothetical protein
MYPEYQRSLQPSDWTLGDKKGAAAAAAGAAR